MKGIIPGVRAALAVLVIQLVGDLAMGITSITAQEILDSRGNPTVEAVVVTHDGMGRAAVPSGASTGSNEALELRDGDQHRYGGKGVLKAVGHVNEVIGPKLRGMDAHDQEALDMAMLELDGTKTKSTLGANAMLAVSMAACRAAAKEDQVPLYTHIHTLFGGDTQMCLPVPMMNLLNGGKHAVGASDLQEYMIMPHGAESVSEAIRWGAEVFHALGKLLVAEGFQKTVGDEGGYAPALGSNERPLELLVKAIETAGYVPGKDISLAMDPAATEVYHGGIYDLTVEQKQLSSEAMVALYEDWASRYPIVSIEDSHSEDDWDGFVAMTRTLGDRVQVVGDDLYVTNTSLLAKGIEKKASNAILVKLNQIGTVWETIEAVKMAHAAGMRAVISHRSGETEDTFIADFAVGSGAGQIKTGSLSRSDRVAKYNQLMRIERELGTRAQMYQLDWIAR